MTAPAQPVAPVEARIEATGGVRLAVRRWEPTGPAIAPGQPDDHRSPTHGGAGSAPVLLVHGLASNARLWDGVAVRLAALGHPVAAVDLRGHGRSDKPEDGYDFGTIADDLAAVLAALGWTARDRPPLVAGQSWGGNIVVEFAIRHPGEVRAVACIDGGMIELSSQFASWEQARMALTPPRLDGLRAEEFEAALRAMHPDWPETGIQGTLANVEVRADGSVAPWLSLERHLTILRHLWEHRPTERYGLVRVPVLLVPADGGDSTWRATRRAAIQAAEGAIPTVRTRWITGDHDLHAQFPATIAELLDAACRAELWS